ncbi:hypothetical protein [Variovorax terrae]|uniref:DUF4124 domain-containing protein n=1 Tax=Variovorax terrae TaxID=2923278 RepID=A0A9X1VXN6_9BURK|nr:hypothetical protein [Variovorax terrae]MCJ0765312.1 hypothetical protein [Variovorax terrae]
MKHHAAHGLLLALAGLLAAGTHAEEVWRCGNSYGQSPCPGGIAVPADDARTAAQKAEADAATRRASQTAGQMEQERLQRNARTRAQAAAVPRTAASSASDEPPSRHIVRQPSGQASRGK